MAPEHRVSDDTWRYPVHRSGSYDRLDDQGRYRSVSGHMVTLRPGYTCPESKSVTAEWSYRMSPRMTPEQRERMAHRLREGGSVS